MAQQLCLVSYTKCWVAELSSLKFLFPEFSFDGLVFENM